MDRVCTLAPCLLGSACCFHVSCSRLLLTWSALINVRMLRDIAEELDACTGTSVGLICRDSDVCATLGVECRASLQAKRRITGSAPKLPPPQLAEALALLDKEPLHVDMVDEFASMLQWLITVPALPSCSVFPMFPNQR